MVNHRQRADRRVASRGVNLIVRKSQRTGRPHIWPPALIFGFSSPPKDPGAELSLLTTPTRPPSQAREVQKDEMAGQIDICPICVG